MKLEDILKLSGIENNNALAKLLTDLNTLKEVLDNNSLTKHTRINPFSENLFDWKTKGEKMFGKDKNITIYDTCTIVGNVEIGSNSWIGPYTALDGNGGLKIGENCSISAGVNIVSHDSVKWALSGGKLPYDYAPISIGNNCFIGTGAFISKGVTIGNNCLVGAGAVVTKNVPNNSIALGIPATIKGKVVIANNNVTFEYF